MKNNKTQIKKNWEFLQLEKAVKNQNNLLIKIQQSRRFKILLKAKILMLKEEMFLIFWKKVL